MQLEQNPLARGAQNLVLMLMGFDRELDKHLADIRELLKEKELSQDRFNELLMNLEATYDDNIESLKSKSIPVFADTFRSLLEKETESIVTPLYQDGVTLTDLLKVAEPLSKELTILNSNTPEAISPNTDAAEKLRLSLTKQLKSLLKTLQASSRPSQQLLERLGTDNSPSWEDLNFVSSQSISLIETRLNEEKSQFENYLAEVNAKLTRITEIVESDSSTLVELKNINISFNDSISQEMADARRKIDEKDTAKALKTELLESLDNIATRLEDYQTSYDEKLNDLQNNKIKMSHQVKQLEQENLSLITELQKQRKLSTIDQLTQLPNRLGFNNRLNEELSRSERYQYGISIAILDIDYFKRINDQFGHLVGDKVLKMISKEMRKVCRDSDYLARYGGEEFILLLPETSIEQAYTAVEKIRSHIQNCPFHFQNKPVPITVSGGIAERIEKEPSEKWLNRADEALYASKGAGRNRVSNASE